MNNVIKVIMLIVMKAFVKKLKKIFKIVKFTKQLVHVKYVIILLYLLINNRVKILIIIQIVHNIQVNYIVINVNQVIDIFQINI